MDKKKSIVYFTRYTSATPGSRYRSYAYHSFLQENGFNVIAYPLFPRSYSLRLYDTGKQSLFIAFYACVRRLLQTIFLKKYDIVYIEQELFPYLPFRLEKWLLRKQKHIVIDYDEAVFNKYENSKNKLAKKWCHHKIQQLVALADVIITGNLSLTRWMLPYAKEVIEIPTSISVKEYSLIQPAKLHEAEKKPFRIGWFSSAVTSSHVLLVKDCLLQLQELYNIKLLLIGFDKKMEKQLEGLHYTSYKWQQNTEVSLLKTCSVGIMPLPNEPIARHKSSLPLIQYMACGLPTVSTPTVDNISINHGCDNLFAKTIFEWYSCLAAIIQNQDFYKEAGAKNKALAAQYYSVENNRKIYLSLFQTITNECV